MKEKYYRLVLVAIIFLALLLRFYSFSNRWQIYSDQARDVMVARGALKHKTIPLIGSFSSAGPFVFGPLFYWFIMISYLISPNFLISPWFLITLIDVLLVFIMAEIGEKIEGKKLALILGFLAAISHNQLSRASNLTQHTLVSITSALTILFFILSLKRKNSLFIFNGIKYWLRN